MEWDDAINCYLSPFRLTTAWHPEVAGVAVMLPCSNLATILKQKYYVPVNIYFLFACVYPVAYGRLNNKPRVGCIAKINVIYRPLILVTKRTAF